MHPSTNVCVLYLNPALVALSNWGCTSRVYYPAELGVHRQSLLPWSIGGARPEFTTLEHWGCTPRVYPPRIRVSPEQWGGVHESPELA